MWHVGIMAWMSMSWYMQRLSATRATGSHLGLTLSIRARAMGVQSGRESPVDTSVAIVGAGPSGLTLSLLLAQFGISNILLERRAKTVEHPQAHFINMRSMEIFRGMGDLEQKILDLSPPLREWRKFIYCEKVLGHTFGETDHFKTYMEDFAEYSPTDVAHVSQNKLLPLLFEKARQSTRIKILDAEQAYAFKQEKNLVKLNSRTESGKLREISANYLVCADGANSKLRQRLGIEMDALGGMQSIMNIYFQSKDLASSLSGREAMLYFVFNPSVICVIVAHNIRDGEFVAQVPFFPPVEQSSKFTPEYCSMLLENAIGKHMALNIENIRPWTMSAQVAKMYGKGNVFLVGDAAHVFPPAGGFGMNTGIQDAHNLAWKLALVLQKHAHEKLLESYTSERRKIGLENTALSLANLKETVNVSRVFGLDPSIADGLVSAFSVMRRSSAADVPLANVAQFLLDMGKLQTSPWNPLRFAQSRSLHKMFREGKTLRLLYPKEDIGFCYEESTKDLRACVHDRMKMSQNEKYEALLAIGSRLPHVSFHIKEGKSSKTCSSLDLIALHAPNFIVFTRGTEQGEFWNFAALQLRREKLPLVCICVKEEADKLDTSPETITVVDQSGMWCSKVQVESNSIIVVRPDGHVASIATLGADQDAYTVLSSTLARVGNLSGVF